MLAVVRLRLLRKDQPVTKKVLKCPFGQRILVVVTDRSPTLLLTTTVFHNKRIPPRHSVPWVGSEALLRSPFEKLSRCRASLCLSGTLMPRVLTGI